MDDAEGDADTTDKFIFHNRNNGCSLCNIDSIGYAFLCIKIHLRP